MKELDELRLNTQELNNVDIQNLINEIEEINLLIKSSEEFLLKEIQRLKQDLDRNSVKLNFANELREIDQITLQTFQTKFNDLSQLLSDIKTKETNAWHLIQILRVNVSRLWHIFEAATGSTLTQELIHEDLERLLHHSQIEKTEQIKNLHLLEREHGDLLINMKNIQLSLQHYRTLILQSVQNINESKFNIQNQQLINHQTYEQISKRINHLVQNTKDIQTLLIQYKSLTNDIHYLLKLIYHIQIQIEIHQKSILIYQTKLDKYKQDLTLTVTNRTNYQKQIVNYEKQISRQNQNFKQLENQRNQIIQYRQQLHQRVHILETENRQILTNQQELLENIKQTNKKNNSLEKEVFHTKSLKKNLQYSYRQLTKDHSKQQEITNNLQKIIEINDQRLQTIQTEINQLNDKVNQEDKLINSKEIQIDSSIKENHNLENCLSTTNEELLNQHSKVDESKIQVKILTQKLHRLLADEKPLAKEISHYQRQVNLHENHSKQLELNLKQNQERIHQYKTNIQKLIIDSKQNDQILTQENILVQQYHTKTEQTKENIKILNISLKDSEFNYQNLKEIFYKTENENKQLKQRYESLSFLVQLLGEKQAILSGNIKPLYGKVKHLTKQHVDQIALIEQSKSDVNILNKYYHHLRLYNHQLHEILLFQSAKHSEYLHSQSVSNQLTSLHNQLEFKMNKTQKSIHYWRTLMSNSPDKFDKISKLFLIKNKLVRKTNELLDLKEVFREKHTLYHYLNQIYQRRQKLIEKMDTYKLKLKLNRG